MLPAQERLLIPPAAAMERPAPLPALRNADDPRPISVRELIANDLEVVRLYHELAARHEALIDWVNEQMRQQRHRLGLSD